MKPTTQKSLDVLSTSLKSELKSEEHKATADVLFHLAAVIIGSLESIEKSLAVIAGDPVVFTRKG